MLFGEYCTPNINYTGLCHKNVLKMPQHVKYSSDRLKIVGKQNVLQFLQLIKTLLSLNLEKNFQFQPSCYNNNNTVYHFGAVHVLRF